MIQKILSFSLGLITGFISLFILTIGALSGSSIAIGFIIFGLLLIASKSFSIK